MTVQFSVQFAHPKVLKRYDNSFGYCCTSNEFVCGITYIAMWIWNKNDKLCRNNIRCSLHDIHVQVTLTVFYVHETVTLYHATCTTSRNVVPLPTLFTVFYIQETVTLFMQCVRPPAMSFRCLGHLRLPRALQCFASTVRTCARWYDGRTWFRKRWTRRWRAGWWQWTRSPRSWCTTRSEPMPISPPVE